jgi:hypothetical protein
VASRDLRWVQGTITAVAAGDGETQCSKVRSDEVQDGSSLRSQAAVGRCGFTHRRSKGDHPPPVPILCAAFREQEGQLVGITADCTNDIPSFQ